MSSLHIYGQTEGTGALSAGGNQTSEAISAFEVNIFGGSVSAVGTDHGIDALSFMIGGGSVTAEGGSYGIGSWYIFLSWMNPADSIYANSYSGVRPEKILYREG